MLSGNNCHKQLFSMSPEFMRLSKCCRGIIVCIQMLRFWLPISLDLSLVQLNLQHLLGSLQPSLCHSYPLLISVAPIYNEVSLVPIQEFFSLSFLLFFRRSCHDWISHVVLASTWEEDVSKGAYLPLISAMK